MMGLHVPTNNPNKILQKAFTHPTSRYLQPVQWSPKTASSLWNRHHIEVHQALCGPRHERFATPIAANTNDAWDIVGSTLAQVELQK